MKFGKSVLSPNYFRQPDFDSLESVEKTFEFECLNCRNTIVIEYQSLIGNGFSWDDEYDEKTSIEVKRFYDMNAVNKTPDGGQPIVSKCFCENCQTQYLIYVGVNEYYNSLYKITLQGITEISDESNK